MYIERDRQSNKQRETDREEREKGREASVSAKIYCTYPAIDIICRSAEQNIDKGFCLMFPWNDVALVGLPTNGLLPESPWKPDISKASDPVREDGHSVPAVPTVGGSAHHGLIQPHRRRYLRLQLPTASVPRVFDHPADHGQVQSTDRQPWRSFWYHSCLNILNIPICIISHFIIINLLTRIRNAIIWVFIFLVE